MLQREDGGGHQHGHLLAVAHGLERRADRHFRLAEAHIAADQRSIGVLFSMSRFTSAVAFSWSGVSS
jgi:hypothetical protein